MTPLFVCVNVGSMFTTKLPCASKVKCFQWNCNSINDNIMACIPLMILCFVYKPATPSAWYTTQRHPVPGTTNFAQETGYENYNGYHLWKSKCNATEPSYSKEEICFQELLGELQ